MAKDKRKQKLRCRFCGRDVTGPGPKAKHEAACENNPDRVVKPRKTKPKQDRRKINKKCPHCPEWFTNAGAYTRHVRACERKKKSREFVAKISNGGEDVPVPTTEHTTFDVWSEERKLAAEIGMNVLDYLHWKHLAEIDVEFFNELCPQKFRKHFSRYVKEKEERDGKTYV